MQFFPITNSLLVAYCLKGGVAADPEKIKAIMEWPTSNNVNEVRSFPDWQDTMGDSLITSPRQATPLHPCKGKERCSSG